LTHELKEESHIDGSGYTDLPERAAVPFSQNQLERESFQAYFPLLRLNFAIVSMRSAASFGAIG
jgi:hypothetical protein